jgi:autotransporter-associated beta strand protein
MPMTVPNGPNDTATFAVSGTTDVSLTAVQTEVDRIVFTPGASAFTITTSSSTSSTTLILSGIGIVNNSGVIQNVLLTNFGYSSELSFVNQATAGSQIIFTAEIYHDITFYDEATAGFGTFTIKGTPFFLDDHPRLYFFDNSNAANGTFINTGGSGADSEGGTTEFWGNSAAANGTFTNKAATDPAAYTAGGTVFFENSTAADGIFTNEGGAFYLGGTTTFYDNATAGNATVTADGASAAAGFPGEVMFFDSSSAENATLIANGGSNGGGGGTIQFWDTSDSGTARIELFGNGTLDFSGLPAFANIGIGSLEGDGIVLLGSNYLFLTIGTNDLSTVFSGRIQGSGVVTKGGSGTLTLTRASTYTGGTTVVGGFLKLTNRNGSATGSGPVTIYTPGTLGGDGIVGGNLLVFSGGTLAPGTGATTLTVKKHLEFGGASYYAWRVRTTSATADKVIVGKVHILPGAFFTGIAIGNTALPLGTIFTAIDNTSSGPIRGTFALLPDGGTIKIGNNTFQADYEGGDGNDLTLTVVP